MLAIDRAIYGLAESGLAWYKELKRFLMSEEGGSLIPSEADPCLFSNATSAELADQADWTSPAAAWLVERGSGGAMQLCPPPRQENQH